MLQATYNVQPENMQAGYLYVDKATTGKTLCVYLLLGKILTTKRFAFWVIEIENRHWVSDSELMYEVRQNLANGCINEWSQYKRFAFCFGQFMTEVQLNQWVTQCKLVGNCINFPDRLYVGDWRTRCKLPVAQNIVPDVPYIKEELAFALRNSDSFTHKDVTYMYISKEQRWKCLFLFPEDKNGVFVEEKEVPKELVQFSLLRL